MNSFSCTSTVLLYKEDGRLRGYANRTYFVNFPLQIRHIKLPIYFRNPLVLLIPWVPKICIPRCSIGSSSAVHHFLSPAFSCLYVCLTIGRICGGGKMKYMNANKNWRVWTLKTSALIVFIFSFSVEFAIIFFCRTRRKFFLTKWFIAQQLQRRKRCLHLCATDGDKW